MAFGDFLDSFNLGDYSSWIGPALSTAAIVGGTMAQSNQMEDVAKKQAKSYKDYLSAINPPAEVKQANYNQLASQVMSQAPVARRRLEDTLASRGIRGAGGAAPMGSQDSNIQKALNDAYFKVYGTYNVPSSPGPVSATPSAAEIMGMNAGQVGSYMLPGQISNALKPSKSLELNWNNQGEGDSADYWNWMMSHPAGR
jgi:hypothetical protein